MTLKNGTQQENHLQGPTKDYQIAKHFYIACGDDSTCTLVLQGNKYWNTSKNESNLECHNVYLPVIWHMFITSG